MRNFSKFHAMSDLLTGLQMKNWGLAIRLSGSSEGCGRDFLRNLKIGCSLSPLASTSIDMIIDVVVGHLFLFLPCQTFLPWIQIHCQDGHVSRQPWSPCHWNFLDGQTRTWRQNLAIWKRQIYLFIYMPTWFVGNAKTASLSENWKSSTSMSSLN